MSFMWGEREIFNLFRMQPIYIDYGESPHSFPSHSSRPGWRLCYRTARCGAAVVYVGVSLGVGTRDAA